MGNPASVIRKRTEKRRKRYEQRLGPGVYLPKDERLAYNAEVEKAAAAALKEKKERDAARAKAKAAKPKKKAEDAPAPPAEKAEKPAKK
ncbi:MAG: hypothetical protein C0501_24460 [Isosphaera sp.]|nr:hypothetical protein [Isosphaera sp.]